MSPQPGSRMASLHPTLPLAVPSPGDARSRLLFPAKSTHGVPPQAIGRRAAPSPSPLRDLCKTPRVLEGAAALAPSPETFAKRPASSKVRPLLLPLLGERVGVRGLPGNSPSGYAKVSLLGDLCTTPFVREGAGRSFSLSLWERVGVRGLPGNRPQGYAKVSPRGEGWGEGSSGQPSPGYAKVSLRERAGACPGRDPGGRVAAPLCTQAPGTRNPAQTPCSGRRSPPKCAPPPPKSFLEKTLTRATPPHFALPSARPMAGTSLAVGRASDTSRGARLGLSHE